MACDGSFPLLRCPSFALEPLLPKKLHTKSQDKLDRDEPERERRDKKKEKRNSKHQEIFDKEMKTTEIPLQPAEAVILSETVWSPPSAFALLRRKSLKSLYWVLEDKCSISQFPMHFLFLQISPLRPQRPRSQVLSQIVGDRRLSASPGPPAASSSSSSSSSSSPGPPPITPRSKLSFSLHSELPFYL